jgi:hypothetical protein
MADAHEVCTPSRICRASSNGGLAECLTQKIVSGIRFNGYEFVTMTYCECVLEALFVQEFRTPNQVRRFRGDHCAPLGIASCAIRDPLRQYSLLPALSSLALHGLEFLLDSENADSSIPFASGYGLHSQRLLLARSGHGVTPELYWRLHCTVGLRRLLSVFHRPCSFQFLPPFLPPRLSCRWRWQAARVHAGQERDYANHNEGDTKLENCIM